MEEDNGAPSSKKVKMETEEPKEPLKDNDHSEQEAKGIEDDDDDGPPSGWQAPPLDMVTPPPSLPLPPTSPIPSSPPHINTEQQESGDEGPPPGWDNECQPELPVAPPPVLAISSDIKTEDEKQDARNEDVPEPQLQSHPSPAPEPVQSDMKTEDEKQDAQNEDVPEPRSQAHPTPAPEIVQSDIKTENEKQDARNKDVPEPRSLAHPSPAPELVQSDMNMEQQEVEDNGSPSGWDKKYALNQQAEQLVTPPLIAAIPSGIKTEDEKQNARNEDVPEPQSQAHLSPAPELVQSDINMEQQELEDEGPPPGWDNKHESKQQAEQLATPPLIAAIPSDIKTEDEKQDARNEDVPEPQSQAHPSPVPELVQSNINMEQQESEDEGPPPGWDSKYESNQQAEQLVTPPPVAAIPSDIKTEDEPQDAQNEDGSEPQSQAHPSPVLELVRSDIKVEQQDSEDEGPPPGWDSKSQPEPELQTQHPTTTPSDLTKEDEQQDDEGPPPGWGSAPQQQSQENSSLSLPMVPSGARTENEQKNLKVEGERPQPPPRPQSIPPAKPQISGPKPPMTVNNPEMGQMVCGSCRRLLSYPRGARYVECACCLEENYVLEEHEVGQVLCGGCNVLLMYPYGAPKVRCANCNTETDIGDHNRRQPLSEQQRRMRHHPKRVQMS